MPPSKSKYNFLPLLFIVFELVSFFQGNAQNQSNNLGLTTSSLSFTLATTAQLETKQTIQNALTFTIDSRSSAYQLYARSTAGTGATGTPIPVSKLGLSLRSVNENGIAYSPTGTIYLSTTNQRIAAAAKNAATGYWYYDLILDPIGYSISPGTYTFTITLTMTQP